MSVWPKCGLQLRSRSRTAISRTESSQGLHGGVFLPMPRSNWLHVASIVGLALTCPAQGEPVGHNADGQSRSDQHRPKRQTEPKPSDLASLQHQIDGIVRALKAIEAKTSATHVTSAAERTAQAEEDAAARASDLVWVGGAEAAITAMGVLLVAWTLYHTKRAADAAEKSVKVARNIGRAQVRCW